MRIWRVVVRYPDQPPDIGSEMSESAARDHYKTIVDHNPYLWVELQYQTRLPNSTRIWRVEDWRGVKLVEVFS